MGKVFVISRYRRSISIQMSSLIPRSVKIHRLVHSISLASASFLLARRGTIRPVGSLLPLHLSPPLSIYLDVTRHENAHAEYPTGS